MKKDQHEDITAQELSNFLEILDAPKKWVQQQLAQKDAPPDLEVWNKKLLWSPEQGILLLLNLNPDKYLPIFRTKSGSFGKQNSKFKIYQKILELYREDFPALEPIKPFMFDHWIKERNVNSIISKSLKNKIKRRTLLNNLAHKEWLNLEKPDARTLWNHLIKIKDRDDVKPVIKVIDANEIVWFNSHQGINRVSYKTFESTVSGFRNSPD